MPILSPLLKSPPSSPNTLLTPASSPSSLRSPPALVSILDSDFSGSDDSFYSYPNITNMSIVTTTLFKCNTTAVYTCEQGRPPVISPGKLTPDLLFNFENSAYTYFLFKDIKAEKEGSKIAGSLQDECIQTWYCLNWVAVDAAGFPAFMKHIRDS